jgi:hypothetical protein
MQPKPAHVFASAGRAAKKGDQVLDPWHVVSWGFAVNSQINVSSIMRRASQAFLQLEGASGGIRNRAIGVIGSLRSSTTNTF